MHVHTLLQPPLHEPRPKQISKQPSKHATNPFCELLCHSGPSLAISLVVCTPTHSLPHPRLEPQTHRWRPSMQAPSWAVPSCISAFECQKQPFWTKIALERGQSGHRRETRGALHMRLERFGALQLHDSAWATGSPYITTPLSP